MKKLIILLAVIVFVLTGCSKYTKLETPPWSDKQIEKMQEEEIESVPVAVIRF